MEQLDSSLLTDPNAPAQRTQFLKTLCILSFVMCGLNIIVLLFGWIMFGSLSQESVAPVWEKVIAQEPRLSGIDPMLFMDEVKKVCLYFLLANMVSLFGVFLMWRMNRIGFFIYVAAELITNFFSIDIEMPNEQKSYLGLIFYLIIDIAFFVLYAMNLKPFRKNN